MTTTRLAAAAAALAVALAVACAPPRPQVCDSLARFSAAATSKAAPCNTGDGGTSVSIDFKTTSPAVCAANQGVCTDNDKELMRIAADCAEKQPACDPADGGAFGWAFGFALGCASSAQNVSAACQAAVVVKDGG